ncbi:hypothetical protein CPHO_04000 [Corynebacterium phocae]|uniref:Restriction endonuclease type IV Mrr domain-containing protein n=1 Tax=Corynebacterium phocae TaxID=161895 RepID=A0A1L7D297_9CORY|nr:restriction endonuclease [Corynebacterium phocae]APT92187.1 hypothetical protein CPHO_04000 [Corynebacterium phocae]KAA8725765.1 hypothetical protein F4V58_03545 [Corynebacterium phocae]
MNLLSAEAENPSPYQHFIGSLDLQGAHLGVFITTSSFTQGAKDAAARYRNGRIILIDGIRLTELMLEYDVAVQKALRYTVYEVDENFFDEDLL